MPKDSAVTNPDEQLSFEEMLAKGLVNVTTPVEGPSDDDEDVEGTGQFEYKDQAAAEKAVKEAKALMTKATTEAANLKKELEKARKAQVVEEDIQEPVDPLDALAAETSRRISMLKEDDPKKNEKIISILAWQSREVAKLERTAEKSAEVSQVEQIRYVEKKLTDLGLENFIDEFWALAPAVPTSIKNLDDAVDWGVKQINLLAEKIQGVPLIRSGEKGEKGETFTIGRGKGANLLNKKEEKELAESTMGDALKQLRKARIYKK
jgi:hypothetical protein